MKTEQARLCIYPKDVQLITGKSERASRALLEKIRETLNKKEHQFVSMEEFCQYTGLNMEQVRQILTA